MVEVVVRNLTDEIGPGDIVGAFTNEAKIKGKAIGNIDFINSNAIVEIDRDVVDKVIDIMNGNQISGHKVIVEENKSFRKYLKRIEDYLKKYQELVDLEREEEMKRHQLEIKNLSGREREKRGRAILNLRGRKQGKALGDRFLVKFMQQPGQKLPDTQIGPGDLVMISYDDPLNEKNPTGTVTEITNYSLTVSFANKPNSFVYEKGLRLDLYANDITYQRMLTALDKLKEADGSLLELRDKLLGLVELNSAQKEALEIEQWFNQNLNKSQKSAVRQAIASEDLFLVHGPPGTGKTVTCIEIIKQAIKNDNSVLATAASNTAVDNLVERLLADKVNVVRIGNPARVNTNLKEQTLDYIIADNPKYQQAKTLREKAYQLIAEQDEYTHPSGRWRRGMNKQEIKKLAQDNRASRGVPAEKIVEMAKWINLQEEIDALFNEVDSLEQQAIKEVLTAADVVCTTNSSAGSDILVNESFDLLVVDEATQASEPSTLIPLTRANKVVLAGDHKQLAPTVLNKEAAKKGLEQSLFERLINLAGPTIKEILKVQYRMNQEIMEFANQNFYQAQLKAATEVKNWKLSDLEIDLAKRKRPTEQVLSEDKAVCFLDIQGMKSPEYSEKDSNSYANQIEAELITEIVENGLKAGLKESDLAIISPYKAQVKLLDRLLKETEIEIDTVDAFQGREKELVILSLVRSNKQAKIGFLRDIRRLNVSLTRAKKKVIIIGDSSTITSHDIYQKLVDYCRKAGYYYSL